MTLKGSLVELIQPLVEMKQRGRKIKCAPECSRMAKKFVVLWFQYLCKIFFCAIYGLGHSPSLTTSYLAGGPALLHCIPRPSVYLDRCSRLASRHSDRSWADLGSALSASITRAGIW